MQMWRPRPADGLVRNAIQWECFGGKRECFGGKREVATSMRALCRPAGMYVVRKGDSALADGMKRLNPATTKLPYVALRTDKGTARRTKALSQVVRRRYTLRLGTSGLGMLAARACAGASAMEQHIDISRREAYLTDSEFEPLFRMTRSQYEALPDWHKAQLKKELFLF